MNTASLENCKKLFELSRWDNTMAGGRDRWVKLPNDSWDLLRLSDMEANGFNKRLWFVGIPAYDAGYLLRKLQAIKPENEQWATVSIYLSHSKDGWFAKQSMADYTNALADTPEDALALLAIELIKAGVLTPEKEVQE